MTISNEAVEAAAAAHANRGGYTNWEDWGDWNPEVKTEAMDDMRAALEAAAPFIRADAKREALEEAADRFDTRSETLLKTMQNMADSWEYGSDDITRYGAYSVEANTTAAWLRARAAAVRGEG
jgi:hypothetical protein